MADFKPADHQENPLCSLCLCGEGGEVITFSGYLSMFLGDRFLGF